MNNNLHHNRTRVERPDGSFYSLVEVTVSDLEQVEFHKGIEEQRWRKLADVAHQKTVKAKLTGINPAIMVLWDAYGHDVTFTQFSTCYPSDDVVYLSKNSVITMHLRELLRTKNYLIEDGILRVKEICDPTNELTQSILDELYLNGRIKVIQSEPHQDEDEEWLCKNVGPYRDVIAVGKLGFPSSYAWKQGYPVVFNTSFFLFEEEDFQSDFSLYGDAYNLQIRNGIIESPPLHERSTLLFDFAGQAELKSLALRDMRLNFLDQEWDLGDQLVYTRYSTVNATKKTMKTSPQNVGFVDFVIIDRSVVGYKYGGGIEIPHNGFVLSLPEEKVRNRSLSCQLSYAFKEGSYRAGIQCGPGLVRAGKIVLNDNTLKSEQFFQKRIRNGQLEDSGVVPTDYAPDIDQTRAARTAIGVTKKGEFKILVAESVNKGMAEFYGESSGITLEELASLAHERGYYHALNLDGGGSATIYYQYGQLTKGADRRGLPGVTYERMVPSVGVVAPKK